MSKKKVKKNKGVRILLVDIETAPILANVWDIFDQNVGLNQIEKDTHLLSFAAKWLDSKEMIYADQRNEKDIENDKKLVDKLWKLFDEADIVMGHNGKRFDVKRVNARIILHGLQPPSSFRQIDTLNIVKKNFGFTSNKLEYLLDKLCPDHKKSKHHKFPGFELWKECLKGNKEAWDEMEKYNKQDVVGLEALYNKLAPWDSSINFNVYSSGEEVVCSCGGKSFLKRGFYYTDAGKFQRYRCNECGKETRDGKNLLSKEKKASLKRKVVR